MKMLVLVDKITNRVHYALDLVFSDMLGMECEMTDNVDVFAQSELPKMHYGNAPIADELFLKSADILFEHDISLQTLNTTKVGDELAFFPVYSQQSILPFDVFAASFYVVSRYEEYLPFVPDRFGRFMPESSCLFENGVLEKPIVDIWANMLFAEIRKRYPNLMCRREFEFLPTYDVDSAWAYKHKGLFRTIGGFGRDFLAHRKDSVRYRMQVLLGREADPFDSYDFQFHLQNKYKLHPIYFILCGDYNPNDKSVSIRNTAFQNLIKHLGDYAEVGLHPSYTSYAEPERLEKELQRLSSVLNREVTQSRFHFLHMGLPHSYQRLIELDITDDYTMGYASQPGFRAGTSRAFRFFDIENDTTTNLTVHPFALMDGTMRDYLGMDVAQSLEKAKQIIDEVKKVNGTFCYLTHNETLGGKDRWKGWPEMYEKMIQYIVGEY